MEKNDVSQKRLNDFLANLRRSQGVLSRGTLLTLRGQALKGDIEGAERGLPVCAAALSITDGHGSPTMRRRRR